MKKISLQVMMQRKTFFADSDDLSDRCVFGGNRAFTVKTVDG